MMIRTALAFALIVPSASFADGHLSENAQLAAAAFKFCQNCHVVRDDDGNILAGKRAKSGPNLYGVFGRTAGTVEDYRYGKSIVAAGEAGLVWDEETLTAYLQDPKAFLREYLDDSAARSKMSFKTRADKKNDLTAEDVARNFAIYLQEIGPAPEQSEDAPA